MTHRFIVCIDLLYTRVKVCKRIRTCLFKDQTTGSRKLANDELFARSREPMVLAKDLGSRKFPEDERKATVARAQSDRVRHYADLVARMREPQDA